MISEKQLAANRRNAQKSTGPKTEQGKSLAAQNSLKHGLTAATALIEGEDQAQFDNFRQQLTEELSPVGPLETILTNRIVTLAWRLHRADHFQSAAIDTLTDRSELQELQELQFRNSWTPQLENPRGSLIGNVAVRDFSNPRVLDRLLMYERRIENSLHKTRQELIRLQHKKQKQQNQDAPKQ